MFGTHDASMTRTGSPACYLQRRNPANPGYPDPFGPSPNRVGSAVNAAPNGRRLADRIKMPDTEQTSVGVTYLRSSISMTADVVWARGRNLIRTRDALPRSRRSPTGSAGSALPGDHRPRNRGPLLISWPPRRPAEAAFAPILIRTCLHLVPRSTRHGGLGLPAAGPAKLQR